MNLDLSDQEATVLREVLDRHVSDMYAEISHTDNPTFRTGLREQRELLRAIRAKLAG
jgi:hypothetical protein